MAQPTPRRSRVRQSKETARTDPYRSQSKPKGTPQCPICKAVSVRGNWISREQLKKKKQKVSPEGRLTCPACKQLKERYAMGVIELRGESWKEKKELILNTIHKSEKIARSRNDQDRILWISNSRFGMKVYVALPGLARHVGRELEKTFKGITEYEKTPSEPFLRVRWWSDLPHFGHEQGAPLEWRGKTQARSKAFRGRGKVLE